ncbi:SDR family NAD(P)-dependent oxidoreductase [Pseudoduganella violaceinigra]|uniref:SDR family NAD(P)-dependent oxidoreductase n=1 Tax=Pseudoduganella violaceinigra TaxID=246602 RepID=UPI000425A079|nr:SDR family NAD(P)-dependent oxidoreductase [Pseudoduganella violaceinigra]
MPLLGHHAFITGGSRGIGLACARALLADGARVTIAGRDAASLERAAAQLSPGVATCVLDVTDEAAVQAAVAAAARQLGPITILLNNAGQALPAPFAKTSSRHWQQMLDVNLTGAFHCTQAVLPQMLDQGWGRIINIASTAGLKGYKYVSAYVAAKHGLVGLTKALALELASKNITVNAVCPGYTETDIVQDAIANIMRTTGRTQEQARAELAAGNPQQKLVQVEEVANAVAWLCQPAASAMTGQSIAVAGGEVM